MPVTVNTPITKPATTYDTILVLNTASTLDPNTLAMRYVARVGLGAANGSGGYDVLPASIREIVIKDMWKDGTSQEQGLAMQVVSTLMQRYEAILNPPAPTPPAPTPPVPTPPAPTPTPPASN